MEFHLQLPFLHFPQTSEPGQFSQNLKTAHSRLTKQVSFSKSEGTYGPITLQFVWMAWEGSSARVTVSWAGSVSPSTDSLSQFSGALLVTQHRPFELLGLTSGYLVYCMSTKKFTHWPEGNLTRELHLSTLPLCTVEPYFLQHWCSKKTRAWFSETIFLTHLRHIISLVIIIYKSLLENATMKPI